MFLLVFCADKWAIILTALPVSEQLKTVRWQCPMLPIRGESGSWCARHLSTPAPTPSPPSLPLLPPRSSAALFSCLSLSSLLQEEGGLSPLQISHTKRRWWRRWRSELPVQGLVSINETMKVYFARMHVLNSFLCDSWLGNVSVNLIKDSAGSHYFLSTPVPDGVKVHHLHPWLVRGETPAPRQTSFCFFLPPPWEKKIYISVCLLRGVIFLQISSWKDKRSSTFQNERGAKVYSKTTHLFYKTDLGIRF